MPNSRTKSEPLRITKELLLEIGGWRALKEGKSLFDSGKVKAVSYEPPMLIGVVQTGTSTVNARLHLGTRLSDVENMCSCRQAREYGTICPHVIAVGLAYIANETREPSATKKKITAPLANSKSNSDIPKIHFASVDEASSSFIPLELNILLPTNLEEAWKAGEMRIICEGSAQGQPMKPLDAIPRKQLEPYTVSDADFHFLHTCDQLNGGTIPGIWLLQGKDFGTFFNSIVGHPRIWLGKKSRLQVLYCPQKPRLFLDINKKGELLLHLEEEHPQEGSLLHSSRGLWHLGADQLLRLNELNPAYQILEEKDVTIPREQLGQFFQTELPSLERQTDVTLSEKCKQLEFETITPEVHMKLDGLLSGLSCYAEVCYGDKSYVLQGLPGKKQKYGKIVEDWTPDPDNPLRYYIRDRNKERKIQKEIIAAGFEPGKRQPEFYTLSSENRVGQFLGNILPLWQNKWMLEYSSRLGNFLDRCDLIQPEILIESSEEDWLSVRIDYKEKNSGSNLTPTEVQKLLQTGLSHHRLDSGRIAAITNRLCWSI